MELGNGIDTQIKALSAGIIGMGLRCDFLGGCNDKKQPIISNFNA
jgi:hypothetical protein